MNEVESDRECLLLIPPFGLSDLSQTQAESAEFAAWKASLSPDLARVWNPALPSGERLEEISKVRLVRGATVLTYIWDRPGSRLALRATDSGADDPDPVPLPGLKLGMRSADAERGAHLVAGSVSLDAIGLRMQAASATFAAFPMAIRPADATCQPSARSR